MEEPRWSGWVTAERTAATKVVPTAEELAAAVPEIRKAWGIFREHADGWIAERKADEVVSARDEERNPSPTCIR